MRAAEHHGEAVMLGILDMFVLLLIGRWLARLTAKAARRELRRDRRGYSAAATTTETTRNAAQIDCAALGEHELEAG